MRDAGPERVEAVSAGAGAGVVDANRLGSRRVRRTVFRVGHTRRAWREAVA